MIKLTTISLLSLFVLQSFATDKVLINEKSLWNEVENSPPTIQSFESSYLTDKLKNEMFKDNFNAKIGVDSYYSNTKEKQLSPNIPITSPYTQISVGVTKNTMLGMQLGAKIYTSQSTNSLLTDASTSGINASLALDLYKDIGGRITKAKSEGFNLSQDYSKLNSQIRSKSFFNNIRRLYWSLVANNESMKLTTRLISHSEKQVKAVLERYKSKIADEGEVAKYQSQLVSRNAQMYNLQYQKELMVQQLKEFLPQFATKEIDLDVYSISKTLDKVMACTALISSNKTTPLNFTKMDELVQLLKGQHENEKIVTRSYDQIDLKLVSNIDAIGKDFSYGDSFSDLTKSGQPSFNVGLSLTIPFGSKLKSTKEIKKILDKKRFVSQIDASIGKMNIYHGQIIKTIYLLNKVVQSTVKNTKLLEKSLAVTQKKYNQARINVQQLVQEQDQHLESSLQEIEVKKQVIFTLLDYFNVFTETPCEFNEF